MRLTVFLSILISLPVFGQDQILLKRFSRQTPIAKTLATGFPRQIKVLALRVQFQKETPDNDRTTGDGHFDLGANPNRTIDPPPHNKRYFEDQLLAMKNYFLDVSDSNLIIDYTVKPDGADEAFTLNKFMRDYGRDASEEHRALRMAEFFYDAVAKADSSATIDFSQFDYVVIFHAGVGQDFSRRDNTPDDLSSRFVTYDLLTQRFGQTFDGVPVNNGAVKIKNGVVVPETETQALIDPFFGLEDTVEIGLSGILISNFGSQLGMPDLFNTDNGTTGIGVFGLEDQGAVNGDGLIPAEPDPWTKIYMGWAKPIVITDSVNVQLPPKKIAGKNTIVKVPITANEYFLIENKQRDVVANSSFPVTLARIDTFENLDGSLEVDTVYMAGAERSAESGVITRLDEYDSALPGSGLLIWHIDEKIISENLPDNSINNDPNRRGVRLMEGSGRQEIGFTGSGDRFDFFFQGNSEFKVFNQNVDSVFLTPASVPNSLSNDRANHGIAITQISARQTVMSFNVRTSMMQKGFPQFAGETFGGNSITFGDIAGDAHEEIVAVGQNGNVFAWQADGQKVIINNSVKTYYGLGGDSVTYPVALFATTGDSVLTSPALADLDNDGKFDVVCGTRGGKLYAWKAVDANTDGMADTLFVQQSGSPVTSAPMITADKKIIFGHQNGVLTVLNSNGALINTVSLNNPVLSTALYRNDSILVSTSSQHGILSLSTLNFTPLANFSALAVTGDLQSNGNAVAVAIDQAGSSSNLRTYFNGNGDLSVALPQEIISSPSLADIDKDGFLEILFAGNNKIYAYNHNGTLLANFPITIDAPHPVGAISSSVLVGDIDSDNESDVITATPNGLIYAYDARGRLKNGFPLATESAIYGTPALLNADKDGDIEIAATSDNGFVYVWNLNGDTTKIQWGQFLHDAAHSARTLEKNTIAAPGNDLMPKKSVYNYPNPAFGESTTIRYYLAEPAEVKIHIFDLAGDWVASLTGPGVGLTDNEVTWNLNKIQSGVYFAKVTAKTAGGKKVTRTIKIAVSK